MFVCAQETSKADIMKPNIKLTCVLFLYVIQTVTTQHHWLYTTIVHFSHRDTRQTYLNKTL